MKLQVTHDRQGNILAIAVQAPYTDTDEELRELQEQELQVFADVGQIVSEVEIEDDPADFADEEKGAKRLSEIAERFKVDAGPEDVAPATRKLVRRKRSGR
jgi:hypothetical protein